jgi:hypothetical protein
MEASGRRLGVEGPKIEYTNYILHVFRADMREDTKLEEHDDTLDEFS